MSDDQTENAGLPDIVRDGADGPRKRDRAFALVRRAADRVDSARSSTAGKWLEARARDAVDLALRPESIEGVQRVMITIANFGVDQTRRADPDADLLFDFLAWLESKHGREVVARTFADNTPVLRPTWMRLVASIADPRNNRASPADVQKVRQQTATFLGELAGLEHPDTPPRSASDIVAYFDSEWVPTRFMALAERTAGMRPTSPTDEPRATSRAIAAFVPSLADPTISFLVSSLLAVSNAYLGREILERFPEMIDILRQERG